MAGHTDAHTSVAAEPPEARAAARALEAWKGHAEYYRLKAEGWGRAAAGLQRQLDEARRELVTYDKHAEADIARLMSERDEANTDKRDAEIKLESAEAANQELRSELACQWEANHAEHCGIWPHPDKDVCHWPKPAALLGPQHGDTK
jgi:chromosome segregation ATPase